MPPEPWTYVDSQSLAMWSRVIKKDMTHALIFQSTSYQKRRLIYFIASVSNWLLRHKIPKVKFCQKIDSYCKICAHSLMHRTAPCRLYEAAYLTHLCNILYLGLSSPFITQQSSYTDKKISHIMLAWKQTIPSKQQQENSAKWNDRRRTVIN